MTTVRHPEQMEAASFTRRAWWSLIGFLPSFFLAFLVGRLRAGLGGRRLLVLREGGCGNARGPTDDRGGEQIAQKLVLPHVGPLESA